MDENEKRHYFEVYLRKLFHELTVLDTKFEIYRGINSHRTDRLEELNIAPAFFGIVLNSLVSDIIISLAKFYENYDGRKRSDRNINRFLNFIESNTDIFPTDPEAKKMYNFNYTINEELINEHRAEIENIKGILDNLFQWRDKYFAHFDKKYFLNDKALVEDYPLNYEDIRYLIDLGAKILNKYSVAYNGMHYSIENVNRDDFEKVINILHKYKQDQRKLFKKRWNK